MSRIPRVVVPGCWHHITQRGNRRQIVFFEDADRAMYLDLLARYAGRHGVSITGYCLLSNHVHLVAIPKAENGLAKALGRTHNDYARWLNVKRGESGHVWQSRFYSCPLDEQHQWEALRYVELNAVRAGLVGDAPDWPWSSAAAHTGGDDRTGIVDRAEWSRRWSAETWRDVLGRGVADAALQERIRESTQTGRPAASDDFVKQLEASAHRRLRPMKRGPKIRVASGDAPLELGIW